MTTQTPIAPNIYDSLVADISDEVYRSHRPLLFETMIISFGAGIALYFALPVEPSVWILACGLIILAPIYYALNTRKVIGPVALCLLLICAGLFRATWHSASVSAPILPDYRLAYTVEGWIEGVEISGSGYRWRIRTQSMHVGKRALRPDELPVRVRVKAKTNGLVPGDGVSLKAFMTGPPPPVIASGYDPARRAYFEQIGAYGFSISTPQPIHVTVTGRAKLERAFVRFRHHLTQRIMARAPPETAGLQAALLTGERAYIRAEQTESLRAAGLAHVLAISGLHMGLIAGGAFWLAAFMLAGIDPIARRYDVRKAAAVCAIGVATFYLILSGASVSTQRAYIMAVVLFSAILLSRPAISIRTVAVAAAITLTLHPESLISAGFQMSFAAATALVTVYGLWRERHPVTFRPGIIRRFINGFAGLSVTSAVAGAATGGFAALHFHQVARLGFIANLAAMPFFTFVVMPMGFAAFLALPLGLEHWPLAIMGWGLEVMLIVSDKVSSMPGAKVFFSAAPPFAASIFGLGFTILCIARGRARLIGVAVIAVVIGAWMTAPLPDMRISAQANLSFWETGPDGRILYVERKRADGYGISNFTERAGEPDADIVSFKTDFAKCDARACAFTFKGRNIVVAPTPEIADQVCDLSDLIIITDREAGAILRRRCNAQIIDAATLKQTGALSLYFKSNRLTIKTADPISRQSRPWGRRG